MSAPQMTTAEALRSAIAETLSIDAQGLQAAIGQLVVATSAECPDAGPDAHSLCDPQTRTTVLLADRIPAGQEAAAVAREIERHHGRQAAQAVLGARASELLGDDGKVYEFSQVNNNEMGILIQRSDDANLYKEAYEEAQRIIRISDEVRISLERVFGSEPEHATPQDADAASTGGEASSADKLTSSKLAQKFGLKTAQFLDRAVEMGYIMQQGDGHALAPRGEKAGVEFVAKSRFGPYFLWPQEIALAENRAAPKASA